MARELRMFKENPEGDRPVPTKLVLELSEPLSNYPVDLVVAGLRDRVHWAAYNSFTNRRHLARLWTDLERALDAAVEPAARAEEERTR